MASAPVTTQPHFGCFSSAGSEFLEIGLGVSSVLLGGGEEQPTAGGHDYQHDSLLCLCLCVCMRECVCMCVCCCLMYR